jgi:hypothetical protein
MHSLRVRLTPRNGHRQAASDHCRDETGSLRSKKPITESDVTAVRILLRRRPESDDGLGVFPNGCQRVGSHEMGRGAVQSGGFEGGRCQVSRGSQSQGSYFASSVWLAYSAIEEMQIEPRPHGKRPVMRNGVWDEEACRDLRGRLDRAGVRSAAPLIWNVRGTPTPPAKSQENHIIDGVFTQPGSETDNALQRLYVRSSFTSRH